MDKQDNIFELNRLLANYFVVYIQLHRYRWYVKGENSFTLTTIFHAIQQALKKDIDKLAEYILAIGGKPFATMIKFIKEASIEEATADDEELEIMGQLQDNLDVIQKSIDHLVEQTDGRTAHFLYHLEETIQEYLVQCRAYHRH